jgi:hypothetical protein
MNTLKAIVARGKIVLLVIFRWEKFNRIIESYGENEFNRGWNECANSEREWRELEREYKAKVA